MVRSSLDGMAHVLSQLFLMQSSAMSITASNKLYIRNDYKHINTRKTQSSNATDTEHNHTWMKFSGDGCV